MGFTGASERKKNADTMRYYIDMHNHIIPRVDDGSNSMDESMALIDMEYKEGVRKLICTPHYIRNRNNYDYDRLERDTLIWSFTSEMRCSVRME